MSNENSIVPNIKVHRNYIFLIGIIAILFSIRECSNNKNVNDLIESISNYSDSAKYYKNKNGELVAYNSVLKVHNEEQLRAIVQTNEQIREEIKKFKDVKSVTVIKEKIYIHDTIELPPNVIPCDFKPFAIRKSNENYTFKGILSPKDFVIDSIYVPNKIGIIIGKRKVGFMKYEEQVTVTNSNPYITTTNLSNIQVKKEQKWWEKGWVKVGAGFALGYGLSTFQQAVTK